MGPACAVVDEADIERVNGRPISWPARLWLRSLFDAQADGATLWTGSQKPHFARDGAARALGLPQDILRDSTWRPWSRRSRARLAAARNSCAHGVSLLVTTTPVK
jgi:hypothetical protein